MKLELKQFFRNKSYLALMFILLLLMVLASWNTSVYTEAKQRQINRQLELVSTNDIKLLAQIDSLKNGLATYETSYTLPTSGIRLTYNNHRLTWLPFQPFSIIAIGQNDIFNNYKKIVLYFNDSYEMSSEELVSPLEQLFAQLDLAFVWVYLLPLIILLTSFNIFSGEKESGRLSLIASQPLKLAYWVLQKIGIRFIIISSFLITFTLVLLLAFRVDVVNNVNTLVQLILTLLLYSSFWFLLCFLVNLAGYSSGKSLIILTSCWVLFVFLIPSLVNQLAKEMNPIPSRLSVINHHQAMYNEMEQNLSDEMKKLYEKHPDWKSDDPVTADLSNSTGWNINYLAKQYIAQIKHKPMADYYEDLVDKRNKSVDSFKFLSPSMILQSALVDMAGTSSRYYRSYLRQAQQYADTYRQYVFKRIFTNHHFTHVEIENLPVFNFDKNLVDKTIQTDLLILFTYLLMIGFLCYKISNRTLQIK